MPRKQKRTKFEKRKQNCGSASVFLLGQRTHKYRKLSVDGWGAAKAQIENFGQTFRNKKLFENTNTKVLLQFCKF
jgi:hypothetical protein